MEKRPKYADYISSDYANIKFAEKLIEYMSREYGSEFVSPNISRIPQTMHLNFNAWNPLVCIFALIIYKEREVNSFESRRYIESFNKHFWKQLLKGRASGPDDPKVLPKPSRMYWQRVLYIKSFIKEFGFDLRFFIIYLKLRARNSFIFNW